MKPQLLGRRRSRDLGGAADKSETTSTAFKALKTGSLVVITVQNCSLMMVTSYSLASAGPRYLSSTAVVAGELVKTFVVLGVLLHRSGACGLWDALKHDICSRDAKTVRYAVPALFYTVQNNLWYHAMSNLDSVTAAVMSQLKVPSTAIFSILVLGKKLNLIHWAALLMLVFGLVCMQLKGHGGHHHSNSSEGNYYLGMLSMVLACTSSGYAGVYLELLFKQLNADVWTANLQLQTFCVPIALMSLGLDFEAVHDHGVLYGWDRTTCLVVMLNALGGFAVSLTMKYADNILKTFAVSMSLVLNCILSSICFAVHLDAQEIAGVALVISSTWLYSNGNAFATGDTGNTPRSSKSSHGQETYDGVELEELTGAQDEELVIGKHCSPAGKDPLPVFFPKGEMHSPHGGSGNDDDLIMRT